MDNVLNLVYDDWPDNQELPNANEPEKFLNIENNQYELNSHWEPSYKIMQNFENTVIKNYRISDIKKYPNKKFFYQIWHRYPLIYSFFNNNKLPLKDSVIEYLKNNKNLNIMFINEVEVEPKSSLIKLIKILKSYNINESKIWIVNNNQKLKDWKIELNTDINVHMCRHMALVFKNEIPCKFKLNKDPNSFFMCHNRSPRLHRYALLCLLKNNKILDDTNWSFINCWQYSEIKDYRNYFSNDDINILKNEIDYFENIDTIKSKYELNFKNFDNRIYQNVFNYTITYENSYVNITTETNFEDDAIHITEKSFKPFYYFQFPLILASYEHIKYLKKTYGFDLFDDVINHSYDNIKNNRDRLFAFVDELKRIHKNKEFFIEFYKNNKERFIKNYNILKNYKNENDYNFFKELAK